MKKGLFVVAAVFWMLFILGRVPAEPVREFPAGEPDISDARIDLDFKKQLVDISFQYKELAGNIAESKIEIALVVQRADGEVYLKVFGIEAPDFGDSSEITPEMMTQGRHSVQAPIPDAANLWYSERLLGAVLRVTDCQNRSTDRISLVSGEDKSERKMGI